MPPAAPALPRRLHAAGHFARTLSWSFTDLALGYYLHARLGLPAAQTGQLLFVSLAYSAVLDLLLAALFTAVRDQRRTALRLQLAGGAGTAASACLLFHPALASGGEERLAWLLAASLLFRTCYAVFDVAQNALTSLLPADDADAERYVTNRARVVPASKLCIAAALFAVVGDAGPAQAGNEWRISLAIGALVLLAAVPLACWRAPPLAMARAHGRSVALPMAALGPVLVAIAAETALTGLAGRVFPFIANGAALTFAMVAGMVLAPWITTGMQRSLGSELRTIIVQTVAGWGCVGLLLAQPPAALAITCAAGYGVCLAGVGLILWRRTALIARHHAARTGRHDDLTCFALLTGTMKLSIALSSLLLGQVLAAAEARHAGALDTVLLLTISGGMLSIAALALDARRGQARAPWLPGGRP
ncbi:MFS transporter [Stenotrophomonas sp. 24(2023)]|uniref:MFS transporter n=1 Tax=Stenotrophomonas sp. 24(2023) TaxID=3068324 RepID=UPI0027E1FEC5|nr:MFS transporter [Stenotrophomonas sp. 24(2023)]WMJ71241.1 MFS transporter [Stenotrophomonas sp. 24(2023)]